MNQFKKCQLVMLSTEKATKGCILRWENDGGYKRNSLIQFKGFDLHKPAKYWKPQHIYALSDEEIKEGDWYYNLKSKTIHNTKDKVHYFVNNTKYTDHKKIIATTDESLRTFTGLVSTHVGNSLPRPSDSFIKKYCELGGIDEVMVEYENYHGINTSIAEVNTISGDGSLNWQGRNDLRDYKLKIAPDNTITIRSIKDSYSRKELIEFIKKFKKDYDEALFYSEEAHIELSEDKWIEENL